MKHQKGSKIKTQVIDGLQSTLDLLVKRISIVFSETEKEREGDKGGKRERARDQYLLSAQFLQVSPHLVSSGLVP